MHEVSICESILDILREQAAEHGKERITHVKLVIGEMAGVIEAAMSFSFEVVTKGTIADGAVLEMEFLPLTARCNDCGRDFRVEGYAFSCAHCDSPSIEIVSGRELMVEDIELE
jgi:hydrogenase nickel incorporation protein HypA/HybF